MSAEYPRVPKSFEAMAFIGEGVKDPEYMKMVDETAVQIHEVLNFNPITEVAKRGAAEIVAGLAKPDGWQVDSVEELIYASQDRNRPTHQTEAVKRLKILTDATYIAMRYGESNKSRNALGSGVVDIEEMLPQPLKGLGEKVLENVFNKNGRVIQLLKKIDAVQLTRGNDEVKINTVLDSVYDQLVELRINAMEDSDEYLEALTAETYVGIKIMERQENVAKTTGTTRAIMPTIPQTGKDVGSTEGGAQVDAQMALGEIGYPKDTSDAEMERWILETTDSLARGTLFWSGQWQQYGPELGRRIQAMYKNKSNVEVKMAEHKEYLQAILACRIQEQAILHCDGTASSYSKMLPPPGEMPEDYSWDEEAVKKTEVGLIGELRTRIRQMAYTPEGGVNVAVRLKNADSINKWAEYLAGEFGKKDDVCAKEKARVAIAAFIVDDYANWSLWSSKTSVEPKGLEKVPWMKVDYEKFPLKKEDNAPNDSVVWQKRVIDQKGTLGWVEVWGSNFSGSANGTCIQHPYLQFKRPVDLYRFKSSWNEELLGQLENSLSELALRKFVFKEDESMKGGGVENMLMPSKVNLKDFIRWNTLVDKWVGGSQADGLDNFKTWLEGAEQLKALLQTRKDVFDFGGRIAAEIFLCKVKAFMSMKDTSFLDDLSNALGTDPFEVKEFQAARGDLLGSGGAGEFGQLFEAMARINLNILNTEEYRKAHAMLFTGVKEPEKALNMLKIKKTAILGQTIFSVLGGLGGAKKRSG